MIAFFLCLLFAEVTSFGYNNFVQLPYKSTRHEIWYKDYGNFPLGSGVGGSPNKRSVGCNDQFQCNILDQTHPLWKFPPTYVQSFRPLGNLILIGFDQDDDWNAITSFMGSQDGALDMPPSQPTQYTGIVVAIGDGVSQTTRNMLSGTSNRVFFAQDCSARWSLDDWRLTYGVEKQYAMFGKLRYGVDLNNAEAWGRQVFIPNVEANFLQSSRDVMTVFHENQLAGQYYLYASYLFEGNTADYTENNPPYLKYLFYSGSTGDLWTREVQPFIENLDGSNYYVPEYVITYPPPPLSTPPISYFQGASDSDTPQDNANQQSNYLLCPESLIYGVIMEDNFAHHDSTKYLKSSSVYLNSKQPWSRFTSISYANYYTLDSVVGQTYY